MKGNFIVLYGPNNIGKSTQVELLRDRLVAEDRYPEVHVIKFPMYGLEPTGPVINSVIRRGLEMNDFEFQQLTARNRGDFQVTLSEWLSKGHCVISEDYSGTGIAWGMADGIPFVILENMNKGFIKEDLAIFMKPVGRFSASIESGHRFEARNEKWQKGLTMHEIVSGIYNWNEVDATGTESQVHEKIWEVVQAEMLK